MRRSDQDARSNKDARTDRDSRNLYQPEGGQNSRSKRDRGKKGARNEYSGDARGAPSRAPSRSRGDVAAVKNDTSPELQRGRRSVSVKPVKQSNAKYAPRDPRDKSYGSTSRSRETFSRQPVKVKAPSISDFDSAMENIKKMREATMKASPSPSPASSPSKRVDSKNDIFEKSEGGRESLTSSVGDDMRSAVDSLVSSPPKEKSEWGDAPVSRAWSLDPSPTLWKADSPIGGNWGKDE
jgi:hypothetical protein